VIEAMVDLETADVQMSARLAEGLKRTAGMAVDAKKQWLSALQSLASLTKAEAQLAAWEPREGIGVRGSCENSAHVGDRLVDRRDLLERRIEWRRLTDQGRHHVRIVRRECRACGRERELEPPTNQGSLWTAAPGRRRVQP
jgi:hypothetical protein